MAKRPKTTISLGQPIVDYLKQMVENGEAASIGWAVELIVKERMRDETRKKKTE